MKKLILLLLLTPFCARPLAAAEDCAKSLDACAGAKKSASPFVEASLREAAPPAPAQTPAAAGAAPAKTAAPAVKAAALPAEAPGAVPAPPAGPVDDKKPLSNPLWLLFVGAILAALYFYLAAGRRKGRKK